MHVEIDGIDIAGALGGPYGEELATALIGCSFFPRASEIEGYVVTNATSASTKVTIERPKVPPASVDVAVGSILPSDQVVELTRAHRDSLLAPYPADVKTIEAAGVLTMLNRPDSAALAVVLRSTGLPSPKQRYAAVSVAVRHGMNDLRERLVRSWAALADGAVQLDVVIQFAPYQRKDGNYTQALAVLDRAVDSDLKSPIQHLILLIERAAVLLDLYDDTGDRGFLNRARKTYDEASALSIASKHLALVQKRLEHRRG